jgi:hypothetical protein
MVLYFEITKHMAGRIRISEAFQCHFCFAVSSTRSTSSRCTPEMDDNSKICRPFSGQAFPRIAFAGVHLKFAPWFAIFLLSPNSVSTDLGSTSAAPLITNGGADSKSIDSFFLQFCSNAVGYLPISHVALHQYGKPIRAPRGRVRMLSHVHGTAHALVVYVRHIGKLPAY